MPPSIVIGLAELEPDQAGMGTTISALLIAGRLGLIAQVGDSRVCLVRQDRAVQLTEDHTLIAWQLREGQITREEAKKSPLGSGVGSSRDGGLDRNPEGPFLCTQAVAIHVKRLETGEQAGSIGSVDGTGIVVDVSDCSTAMAGLIRTA